MAKRNQPAADPVGSTDKETEEMIEGLDRAIEQATERSDFAPLEAWAEEAGLLDARAGANLEEIIARAIQTGDTLEEKRVAVAGADGSVARIVAAAVRGYTTAQGEVASKAGIDQLRDQVEELTALHRIISAANSSRKLTDMLQETASAVLAVTHADICSIFLYEPEWDQLVLAASTDPDSGIGQVRLRLGDGITGWTALAGVPVSVRDVSLDPRFNRYNGTQADRAVSMLAVPVVLFTIEKLVGVISVRTFHERDFSETETRFLETVAGEIAIAIENTRLYEQTDARLRQKVAELTALQGVSAHIAATLNLAEVLSVIAHQAAHLVHADASTIYAIHPEAGTMEQVAHYNLRDPHHNIYEAKIGPHVSLDLEQSDLAQAVMRGVPIALPPDTDAELGLSLGRDDYRSMFCVPLLAPRGIMGAICLYDRDERAFSEEQVHLLDAFGHEAGVAIENSRLYETAINGLQLKSAMLQEMNHRVRNNLQTVAGLLSMQLRRMNPDSESATAMRESIARIQSMAAVHDLMMGSDVLSASVYEIAHKITEAAVSTLMKPGFALKLDIEREGADQIRVDSHRATLLALLINELITNAILHGFAKRDGGELLVRAWTGDNQANQPVDAGTARKVPAQVHIEILDNGSGLPAGFDAQRNGNLGMAIVRTMVLSDLKGRFVIEPRLDGEGTRAVISFLNAPVAE